MGSVASRVFGGLVFPVVESGLTKNELEELIHYAAFLNKRASPTGGAYQRTRSEYPVMAWYAYCIGEKKAFPELARHRKPVPLESVLGVSGNQVFLYPASDLAVVVSEHNPVETLNQKSGVDHARVIADCFKHSTVLPFRFGRYSTTTTFCADRSVQTSGSSCRTSTSCAAKRRCT